MPENIIKRAKQILENVEQEVLDSKNFGKNPVKSEVQSTQLEISDSYLPCQEFVDNLKNVDISVLTPIESMNMLYELVKKANQI